MRLKGSVHIDSLRSVFCDTVNTDCHIVRSAVERWKDFLYLEV